LDKLHLRCSFYSQISFLILTRTDVSNSVSCSGHFYHLMTGFHWFKRKLHPFDLWIFITKGRTFAKNEKPHISANRQWSTCRGMNGI